MAQPAPWEQLTTDTRLCVQAIHNSIQFDITFEKLDLGTTPIP